MAEQEEHTESTVPAVVEDAGELVSNEDLRRAIAAGRNRVALLDELMKLSLTITTSKDWKDFDGPYLQTSGCRKLGKLWGIYFKDRVERPSLEEAIAALRRNEPVAFTVMGTVGSTRLGSPGHPLESQEQGGRSSDDFFTEKGRKPLSELDVKDILNSAHTNFEGRAIRKLLGLENLTWEDLARYGIKRGGRVEFKPRAGAAKGRGGRLDPAPSQPAASAPFHPTPSHNAQELSPDDMRQAIKDRLSRQEKDPDKAIHALTRGAVPTVADLDRAPQNWIEKLFDRLFPPGDAA